MLNRVNVFMASLLMVGGLVSGCAESGEESTTPTPTQCTGGKCDGQEERVQLLSELWILDRINIEGEEEVFELYGVVADDYYAAMEDGHTLKVEVWAMDGASNPDFLIEGSMEYWHRRRPPTSAPLHSREYLGDFLTSEIMDVSELLPYQGLRVAVTGEYNGKKVEQFFDFKDGAVQGELVVEEEGPEPEPVVDPFAEAYDVEKALIYIDEELTAPSYAYPPTMGSFRLSGTEFWQKWEDGLNPTYSYNAGTNAGQKCMYASAIRFQAIMAEPPQSLVDLVEQTNWSGSFFNWNDDFSHETSYQRPRGAALWAWRTSLIKWISQTGKDGACHLPTRALVDRAAQACLTTGASTEGEIQGCQAL